MINRASLETALTKAVLSTVSSAVFWIINHGSARCSLTLRDDHTTFAENVTLDTFLASHAIVWMKTRFFESFVQKLTVEVDIRREPNYCQRL